MLEDVPSDTWKAKAASQELSRLGQVVEQSLVLQCECREFMRQREDDVKVRNRQQFICPYGCLVSLFQFIGTLSYSIKLLAHQIIRIRTSPYQQRL